MEQRRTRYVHDLGDRRLGYLLAEKHPDFCFFAIEQGLTERTLRSTRQVALGFGCRQSLARALRNEIALDLGLMRCSA